jgi:hypothetical protein
MSDACLIPVSKARELAKDNGPDTWVQPIVLATIKKISDKIVEAATLGKLSCVYTFGVEFSDFFVKNIKPLDPDAYYSSDFKKELEKRAIWNMIRMLHDAGYKVEYNFSWDNNSQTNRAKLSIYWHDWEKDESTISSIDKMRKDEEYLDFMEKMKTSNGYPQEQRFEDFLRKELKDETN